MRPKRVSISPTAVRRRGDHHLDPEHIELEVTRMLHGEAGAAHMHYLIKR
jgi:hypothetical protein